MTETTDKEFNRIVAQRTEEKKNEIEPEYFTDPEIIKWAKKIKVPDIFTTNILDVPPFDYPEYSPSLVSKYAIGYGEFTDLWTADRFYERYENIVRYCNPMKKYYIWNGLYWKPDEYSEIRKLCYEHISNMLNQGIQSQWMMKAPLLMKHLLSSLKAQKIRDIMFFLESNRMTLKKEDMDADHTRITLKNCVFNLQTLMPERPNEENYLTRAIDIDYNKDAKCPIWEAHLNLIFGEDKETIESFQMICGYSLLYENPQQVFFIHHGDGQNGKSATIQTLKKIWGDFARSAEYRTFTERRSDDTSIRTDIERLYGSHLVTAFESKDGARLNEQLLKWVTGGDEIVSRGLYEKEKERQLPAKIHLVSNPLPVIKDNSVAMLRRIIFIPYTVTIPEDKKDGKIDEKFLTEREGILQWVIRGLEAWYKNGEKLKLSKIISDATEQYKGEIDEFKEFFEDDIVITKNPKDTVLKKTLLDHFETWYSDKNGEVTGMPQKEFNKICNSHGIITDKRVTAGYVWIGLKVLNSLERESRIAARKHELDEKMGSDVKYEPMNIYEQHPESVSTMIPQGDFLDNVHNGSLVHRTVAGYCCSCLCDVHTREICKSNPSECGRGVKQK